MSFFTYTSNGVALHSDYQMSNALCHPHKIETHTYKWEETFWNKIFQRGIVLAKPFIWHGKTCFGGGLQPFGSPEISDRQIILFTSDKKYEVCNIVEVRQPDDVQYEKHFKKIIEKELVKISDHKDGFTYIKLGNVTYKNFNNQPEQQQ